jgi:hypothetical protein
MAPAVHSARMPSSSRKLSNVSPLCVFLMLVPHVFVLCPALNQALASFATFNESMQHI